jgi:hypothetical protein
MPDVARWERSGMRRILEETLLTKFGNEGMRLMPAINDLDDAEKYLALNRTIVTATTIDEVRRACAQLAAPVSRRKKGGNVKRGSSKEQPGESGLRPAGPCGGPRRGCSWRSCGHTGEHRGLWAARTDWYGPAG